jgi:hypothetical protein
MDKILSAEEWIRDNFWFESSDGFWYQNSDGNPLTAVTNYELMQDTQ